MHQQPSKKQCFFFVVIIKKIIAFLTKILYHQMLHTTIGPYSVPPHPTDTHYRNTTEVPPAKWPGGGGGGERWEAHMVPELWESNEAKWRRI